MFSQIKQLTAGGGKGNRFLISLLQKMHQRVSLPVKITVPFVVILFLSVSIIGWIFYSQARESIITLVEARLEAEAKSVTEKVTLLKYAFAADEEQFNKRLVYELRQQEARMAQKGLPINQFLVQDGAFQSMEKVTKSTIPFPDELAKQMEAKQNGVARIRHQGVDYTLAYAYSTEARYIYVLSILDESYLSPLHQTVKTIMVAIVISLLVSLAFGWFVVRSITSPFRILIGVMKKVSEGDLTERSHLEQEGPELRWIAVSFNFMMEQMSQMIKEIKQMIAELHQGGTAMQQSALEARSISTELSANVAIVNRGVEQTAATTETANRLFAEIKGAIEDLLARIAALAQSSQQMKAVTDDGQRQMEHLTGQIRHFSTILGHLGTRMEWLDQHSQSIGQVVDLIKNIAKQTKLLALNAAIEAARAGEHGKGFAVVANEVAKLAGESETAAVQINQLVQGIQAETSQVVADTKDAARNIAESEARIIRSEQAFHNLTTVITDTSQTMENLGQGLHHISTGLAEVDQSIGTFVAITQETLGSAELMTRAAHQQLASIERSKELADHFIHISRRLDQLSDKFTVA